MKGRDKQWNSIWLYGLLIKTKTQIDIYSPLSKLQGHSTSLQAFILFCRTEKDQTDLQDIIPLCRAAGFLFSSVGLKKSKLQLQSASSTSHRAICRPFILPCRAKRIPTAAPLSKFSFYFVGPKESNTAEDWKKSKSLSHLQAFNSLLQGWTNSNCRFTLQVLHSTA